MKISYKVLFAAVLSIAGTNAFAADVTGLATTNYVKGAIQSLDGTVTGTTGVVKTISQTDGKITATRGTISGDDVSSIPNTKITGLGALATRNDVTSDQISGNIDVSKITKGQTTDNIVNPNADGDIPTADAGSTTKYPSIKAAEQIAATAATGVATDVAGDITELQNSIDSLKDTVDQNKGAADDAIKGLTGTGTGTTAGNGMVKTVTQANGVVTATRGLVATADIADGAVDGKKIKDGAIAAGSNISVSKDATTGVITVSGSQYSLPTATTSVLGGVKSSAVVTATDGVLGIGSEQITSGMIKNGEVKEADIDAQAVSTAKIKSPTATECASGNCALVDLGTGAQWLPIVNEYN